MAQQGDRMRVLLDLTRYEDQELDISGKFNARAGDTQDLLPLWIQNNGFPVDLRTCKVVWGGTDANMVVHQHERQIADFKSYRGDKPAVGKFTLAFDVRTFNIPGKWNQFYIRFVDAEDNTISTVDLGFDVFDDSFYAHAGDAEDSYVEQFERILQRVTDAGADMEDQLREWLAKYKQSLLDAIHEVNDPKDGLYVRYQQLLDMTKQIQTTLKAAQFHDRIFQYNTVQDMKDAIMPLPGDMAATQGWVDSDDARGGFWRIRVKHDGEVPDGKNTILLGTGYVAERNYGIVQDMDPIHIYDTVADMKAADLAKGQTARTLGEYKLNDGGGATYKITDNPTSYSVDLQSGLKAEQINVTDNNFYDEITWYRERDHKHHTDIYYVTIPKNDKNGNLIMPEMNYEGYEYSPTEWARHKHTTLTVNGDAAINVGNNTWMNGNIISGGKIINQSDQGKHFPSRMKSVAIMKDRSVRVYSAEGTTAQQMVDDGAQVAFTVYYQLVQDGKKLDFSKMDDDLSIKSAAGGLTTNHYPCVGLGIKPDGTWIVIGCDGRTLYDNGLTADEFAEKFIDQGCTEAYRFDGGGSSSINWRGIKINKSFDDDMNADRKVRFTLDFIKPTAADNANSIAASQAGVAAQVANYHANAAANAFYQTMQKGAGQIVVKSDQELDDFLKRLPDMLNETQFPNGGIIRGILSTSYHNSAPGKVVGLAQAFDWHFKYYMTGSHNYTMLDMVSVNDANIHIWRSFARTSKPQWGPWQSMFGVTAIPAKLTPEITKLVAFRIGNVVEVDAFVHTSSQAWHTIASGLPVPISSIAIRTLGVNNGGQGRFTIDGNGNLMGRTIDGKLDDFEVHYTYLHGLTNKEA